MLPMLAASHPALIHEHKLLLFQILHFYQLFVSLCSGRDVGKETVNMRSTEVRWRLCSTWPNSPCPWLCWGLAMGLPGQKSFMSKPCSPSPMNHYPYKDASATGITNTTEGRGGAHPSGHSAHTVIFSAARNGHQGRAPEFPHCCHSPQITGLPSFSNPAPTPYPLSLSFFLSPCFYINWSISEIISKIILTFVPHHHWGQNQGMFSV